MKRSRELAAVGAAMVIATTLVAAGPASGREDGKRKPSEPSLVGSAKMLRKDGQDVRFAVDAHVPDLKDRRVGMTVYDNGGHDRVGYSWGPDRERKFVVPPCMSSAPFERVETGDFKAVEWFPPGSGIS